MNLKMTNMFRVLDPGSQFVFDLENDDPLDTIARLVFYRITNLPSTWRAIQAAYGRYPIARDFTDHAGTLADVLDAYRKEGNTIFSGAYIIIPNPGVTGSDKMVDAIALVRFFVEEKAEAFIGAESPDEQYRLLRSTKGLGKFLSMQILTDWGYLQDEEPDPTFVVAGPGSRRGAALLDPDRQAEDVIHDLTAHWSDDLTVTLDGRPLTTMDVQNTLCEFSKYAREKVLPRKKTPYRPAHPGEQPQSFLPRWW